MLPNTLKPALLLIVFLLFQPARAAAIDMNVPCETPSVFAGAPLNVVVLPYSQPASFGQTLTRAGEQLGGLVQLETVLAIAKFGGIGVTQLIGDTREGCTPDVVLNKLLGKQGGALETLRPGGALILIWGRIFESGQDLFLQSYVRFLRAGVTESIDIAVRERTLTGTLSTQAFACAPRKIARRDLDDVQRQFASARLLHERPDTGSPMVRMPEGPGPFAYWVTDVRGEWVQLQPMERRPGSNRQLTRGWLLARATEAQWSLRRQMPELFFVEGVAGYLAARTQPNAAQVATWLISSETAINRYIEAWGANAVLGGDAAAGGTPLAVAVPRQLRGFITLLRARGSVASFAEALPHFERAATLVPYSSNARNLVTMTRMARAYRGPLTDQEPRQFIDDLRGLLGTDPDSASLLANLSVAYDLALSPTVTMPGAERERLTRERDSLRTFQRR